MLTLTLEFTGGLILSLVQVAKDFAFRVTFSKKCPFRYATHFIGLIPTSFNQFKVSIPYGVSGKFELDVIPHCFVCKMHMANISSLTMLRLMPRF
jgi:hypothetical protein